VAAFGEAVANSVVTDRVRGATASGGAADD
jgi:hypothetical protein